MPLCDMFYLDRPQHTPIDATMFVTTLSPAPIDSMPPPPDYTNSESDEMLFHEDMHEFSRLWSHLDATTDYRPPIQSNDQQIQISQPVTHPMGGMYDCEEMDIKVTTSETNSVVTLEGVNKHTLGLIINVLISNRASCNIKVNNKET